LRELLADPAEAQIVRIGLNRLDAIREILFEFAPGGFLRTYPGGTENFSIFETVLALMPNRSAAAPSLIPSIRTACRTRA
jgi:hypothetical protein